MAMIQMIAIHTWHCTSNTKLATHDEQINLTLRTLHQNDCSYISHHTFKVHDSVLRTEIMYKENVVRKVLFEKHKND
jgi:hypothetical protein